MNTTAAFQEELKPIDHAIVLALAEMMPEGWNEIRLVLETLAFDPSGLAHSIVSPEGHDALTVAPDEAVYVATHALEQVFERHGRKLEGAVYDVAYNAEGDLDYRARYEH